MIDGKKFFAIRGYMKSGTNWIGRLLNLHPQISCTGEFHWQRLTTQLIDTINASENLREQDDLLNRIWQPLDRFIKETMVAACDPNAIWVGDRTPAHIETSVIIGARIFNLIRSVKTKCDPIHTANFPRWLAPRDRNTSRSPEESSVSATSQRQGRT